MKLKAQRGNAELFALIVLILVVVVGFWVKAKVTGFATAINVDFDTAGSVLLRLAGVVIVAGLAIWQRLFLRSLAFLPLGLLIAFAPALDYWSVHSLDISYYSSAEPAWYGNYWIQVLGAIGLLVAGYFGQKWIDENT
ncbi:hypothetical protein [Duganella sp. BuS-21]|uniref:hypothetical protein n=1 Tax=Duganella sp. BuS-21 TaxID=2943848 RepID=UPI0035A6D517